jgi:hypothetical protein
LKSSKKLPVQTGGLSYWNKTAVPEAATGDTSNKEAPRVNTFGNDDNKDDEDMFGTLMELWTHAGLHSTCSTTMGKSIRLLDRCTFLALSKKIVSSLGNAFFDHTKS